ncbi:MAG: LLM class flavin-dependent oxidoreductase [Myxococcales bacterium]|nr:LLM class flavin-dependent oxidoreductase [Myxococcales bacterium]
MRLSILDVLPVTSQHSPSDALRGALELARLAERLGYTRLWYAEHHGMASIASTSPELMIAHAGGVTRTIRLGAGGVMLPNHAPLRVVEQYRTLAALHPGRVDLGIGRAAGTDPLTARALGSASGERFPGLMRELLGFSRGTFPKDHPYSHVRVIPEGIPLPPIWMLGSSGGSAELAGAMGSGYAFAGHFSPVPAAPATHAYRRAFRPSADFPEPRVILAVHALCAETDAAAKELAVPVLYSLSLLQRGRSVVVLSPEEVRAKGWIPSPDRVGPMGHLLLVGDPPRVRAAIERAAAEAGADEVMVMTLAHDPALRLRSYELLAAAFGLPTPGDG